MLTQLKDIAIKRGNEWK